MRNQILVLIVLVFVACQKVDEITELPDNIIYTVITPDIVVSSIDTVYYLGYDDNGGVFSCDSWKSNGDYSIDLNGDNILDLQFEHKFWGQEPYLWSPHFWGSYYRNMKIQVIGKNGTKVCGMYEITENSDLIDWSIPSISVGEIYKETNIADTNTWIESAIIYIKSNNGEYFKSESQYIGVKIENKDNELFGWVEIKVVEKELNLPLEDADGMALVSCQL